MTPAPAPAPTSDQVTDVLLKAADLIHEHGHAKGVYVDSERRLCMAGALDVACGYRVTEEVDSRGRPWLAAPYDGEENQLARHALGRAARLRVERVFEEDGVAWESVPTFNDRPDTAPDDVVHVLKRAADLPDEPRPKAQVLG